MNEKNQRHVFVLAVSINYFQKIEKHEHQFWRCQDIWLSDNQVLSSTLIFAEQNKYINANRFQPRFYVSESLFAEVTKEVQENLQKDAERLFDFYPAKTKERLLNLWDDDLKKISSFLPKSMQEKVNNYKNQNNKFVIPESPQEKGVFLSPPMQCKAKELILPDLITKIIAEENGFSPPWMALDFLEKVPLEKESFDVGRHFTIEMLSYLIKISEITPPLTRQKLREINELERVFSQAYKAPLENKLSAPIINFKQNQK